MKEVKEASVLDVARYVIKRVHPVTTMKLQKLVYYCQAWSLAWDEVPLFPEDFEAWANGPVCPELFHKHKGRFRLDNNFLADRPDYPFTDEEKDTMDRVIEHYKDKSPEWLSALTHTQQPWKMARGNTPIGDPCNTVITKESMMIYYGGLIDGEAQ